MKEFMMIFRYPVSNRLHPSPEALQEGMSEWQNWIEGIVRQVKFVSASQLGLEGKVLRPGNTLADGPYHSLNEAVGGNLVVKAFSLDEAVEMAKGCPLLHMGGHVEIRNILL